MMATMAERIKIFAKAQLSAFVGGIFDYIVMILLTELGGMYYPASIAVACVLGAIVNFSINKIWAFRSSTNAYLFSLPQQLMRFILVVVSGILLKVLGTYLFTAFAHIDYKISRIITDILVSLLFNYVLQRYWVFRKLKKGLTRK